MFFVNIYTNRGILIYEVFISAVILLFSFTSMIMSTLKVKILRNFFKNSTNRKAKVQQIYSWKKFKSSTKYMVKQKADKIFFEFFVLNKQKTLNKVIKRVSQITICW